MRAGRHQVNLNCDQGHSLSKRPREGEEKEECSCLTNYISKLF